MATQRELIYTVKSIIRAGLITDDDKISDRQVAFLIDGARATLLRQQINKQLYYPLNYIELYTDSQQIREFSNVICRELNIKNLINK